MTKTSLRTIAAGAALAAALSAGLAGCASSSSRERTLTPEQLGISDAGAEVRASSALVREAQRYELAGKDAEAIDRYQRAVEAYREMPVAWNNLGRLLLKRGENLAAADAFKTAAELSPTDPRPMYNLGAMWEELGYFDDAERWYDDALTRDPQHLPSLRRAILIDDLRDLKRPITAERLKTALLIEREPWWIDRFKRYQIRLRAALAEAGMNPSGGFDFTQVRPADGSPGTAEPPPPQTEPARIDPER
jgi:tetratricopeptide (TPR) repeat protein